MMSAALWLSASRMRASSSDGIVRSPISPQVNAAIVTLWPSLAYSARVPEQRISMSSGWAPIARMFIGGPSQGLGPEVVSEDTVAVEDGPEGVAVQQVEA
jgi:hypothetical protein